MIVNKPWGYYEDILREDNYVMKRIVIRPGQRLSFQKHEKRSEFWVIMKGIGKVQLGTIESIVNVGATVNIQKKELHRITNIGTEHLVIYETQYGVCDENDIIRVSDDYERQTK